LASKVEILDEFGKPFRREIGSEQSTPTRRATYDAADTTDENYKHWARADNLPPNMATTMGVRRTLRNRSRYERANNPYCRGLVSTISADMIGTGPRLALNIPGAADWKVKQVEGAFANWALASNLADKLRLKCEAKIVDGESISLMTTNPKVQHPVKLDIRTYEADQCMTPFFDPFDPLRYDGMELDVHGNPTHYNLLKYHPGGMWWIIPWETDTIPAESILHWYRPDRPGQLRGIPEISSALPLFAYLRRYTLSTLAAAEIASMLAGIMHTDQSANGPDSAGGPKLYDAIELVRGSLLSLPEGWEATQFQPNQPTSSYKEFKGEILTEIGRCVNATFNIIAGNSSGYNYSSGRLDHVIYFRSIRVERHRMRFRVLDRLFRAWLEEAVFVDGLLPEGLPPFATWTWEWYWDGFESIDPLKDAMADVTNLTWNLTTLKEIYAQRGQDWEPALRQRAKEIALCAELGIPIDAAVPAMSTADKPEQNDQESPGDRKPKREAAIYAEMGDALLKRDFGRMNELLSRLTEAEAREVEVRHATRS
jgi:lambda family phage portal protein